jgi:hypothetical protein
MKIDLIQHFVQAKPMGKRIKNEINSRSMKECQHVHRDILDITSSVVIIIQDFFIDKIS